MCRPPLIRLCLGHNPLRDDGCEELFGFLCKQENLQYSLRLEEIALNLAMVGDKGLASISRFVHGNSSLRELLLQNVCPRHA